MSAPVTAEEAAGGLLPCPFCGSSVSLVPGTKAEKLFAFVCDDPTSPCRGSHMIQCCMEEHVDTAISIWNRRSQSGPLPVQGGTSLPTYEMLAAGEAALSDVLANVDYTLPLEGMERIWHAMLAAAPTAPGQDPAAGPLMPAERPREDGK